MPIHHSKPGAIGLLLRALYDHLVIFIPINVTQSCKTAMKEEQALHHLILSSSALAG
jgi:hypothetical protein